MAAKPRRMDDRLPTHLWVESKLRELSSKAVPVYVLNRGNKTSGLVLVKVENRQGLCRVFMQQRDLEGSLAWFAQDMTDSEADAYVRRELDFDTDLWVLEVEDREMNNPFSS